jgi:hypothetical protein
VYFFALDRKRRTGSGQFHRAASLPTIPEDNSMAKNQNTFEKRRRDMEKKMRAEDKRKKRQVRKDRANLPPEQRTQDSDDPQDQDADDSRTDLPTIRRTL